MDDNGFTVFISATSKELGEAREELAAYFDGHGAEVYVQKKGGFDCPADIARVIDRVTLNVCLVGRSFGKKLGSNNVPGQGTLGAQSITQWELEYALERQVRERKDSPGLPPSLKIYFASPRFNCPSGLKSAAQASFCQRAKEFLQQSNCKFFYEFDDVRMLRDQVRDHCENEKGGVFPVFQEKRWEQFKAAYARKWAEDWEKDFRWELSERLHDERTLLESSGTPLIDKQELLLVEPHKHKEQRSRFDRREEVSGDAPNLTFDEIVSAIDGTNTESAQRLAPTQRNNKDGTGLRLAIVTGSGIGKTTILRRLLTKIKGGESGFAVLIAAQSLKESTDNTDNSIDTEDNIKRALAKEITKLDVDWKSLGFSWDPEKRRGAHGLASPVELACWGVLHEIDSGRRFTVLIDALDHIDSVPPALRRLQDLSLWRNVNVVVAGRPPALRCWSVTGTRENGPNVPDLAYWRMVLPLPILDKELVKGYLGGFSDPDRLKWVWRYDLVADNLDEKLLYVPRVLSYIRLLNKEELTKARTGSQICHMAVRHMIERALTESEKRPPEDDRIERLLKVLAALAFQSLYAGPSGLRTDSRAPYPLQEAKKTKLCSRVGYLYRDSRTETEAREPLEHDIQALYGVSALVGNGLLDGGGRVAGTLSEVTWASPTVQAFFAAYWLAAKPFAPVHAHEGADDATWFGRTLFYPYATNSDQTEELNRFLADMSYEQVKNDPCSWIAAASAWYDPQNVRGKSGSRQWSTEMIARSWRLMHALAGRQVDDWWDISYEALQSRRPSDRHSVNLRRDDLSYLSPDDSEKDLAASCLDSFLGDFQTLLLAGNNIARRFVAEGWEQVPATQPGGFLMGSNRDQGFPPRTLLYWNKQLSCAVNCSNLQVLAERTTPASWWSGPYGKRQRENEVKWLCKAVFKPYARKARGPAALKKATDKALAKIGKNFRRCDETPVEERQVVNSFTFNAEPVTDAIYALFSPGHAKVASHEVGRILKAIEEETASTDGKTQGCGAQCTTCLKSLPAKPDKIKLKDGARLNTEGEERPVIFVSWFDAWAFAQWARWNDGGKEYRCRLPHEPEWEFACKHGWGPDGKPLETEFGQRYWWGNDFYDRYDGFPQGAEFMEEAISTPKAHAVGWPGQTRDPERAEPNGLGLKDMIGNVWEWSANVYDLRSEAQIKQTKTEYTGYSRSQPDSAPRSNAPRSMRGGVWYYLHHIATASNRFRLEPNDADYKIGFRLVRERFDVESGEGGEQP